MRTVKPPSPIVPRSPGEPMVLGLRSGGYTVTADTLEQREMDADLALLEADPEYARSLGIDIRKWMPEGGSAQIPAPDYQNTPGYHSQTAAGFRPPPPRPPPLETIRG